MTSFHFRPEVSYAKIMNNSTQQTFRHMLYLGIYVKHFSSMAVPLFYATINLVPPLKIFKWKYEEICISGKQSFVPSIKDWGQCVKNFMKEHLDQKHKTEASELTFSVILHTAAILNASAYGTSFNSPNKLYKDRIKCNNRTKLQISF